MNSDPRLSFTHGHRARAEGAVTFLCSADREQWPWLALPPDHPIVTQNIQYWAGVEASAFRGTFDRSKWSALTWTQWTNGDPKAGQVAHGLSEHIDDNGKLNHRMTLFDAADVMVCQMHSIGVVFQTRDFEAWRAQAKQMAEPFTDIGAFEFADPAATGSLGVGPSLVSPLHGKEALHATGLIAKHNALPPAHPYMSGSGDHVNATHLAEAAHQFLHLLEQGQRLRITSGEMRFTRYVELGRPFNLEVTAQKDGRATLVMTQAGRQCTFVTLDYDRL